MLRFSLAFAALCTAGCFADLPAASAPNIGCASPDECPSPMTCQLDAGRCAAPGVVYDTVAPVVAAATSTVRVIGLAQTATLTIAVSEPVTAASVTVDGDVAPLDCTPGASVVCSIDAVDRAAGAIVIVVVVSDAAGNESAATRLSPGLTIDPAAPELVADDVVVQPSANNVLFPAPAAAARADSTVVVTVRFDEAPTSVSEPKATSSAGVETALDAAITTDGTSATFTLDAADLAALAEGTSTLTILVEDAVDNVARRSLASVIVIDRTAPAAPTFTRLVRAPFGDENVAGPRTRGDGTAADAVLVLGLPAEVVANNDAVPASVSRSVVEDDGAFEFEIAVDVASLRTVAIDEAGNVSAPAEAARTELVAATRLASSPHEVRARLIAADALRQRGDARVDQLLREGPVTTTAVPVWRPLTTVRNEPLPARAIVARDPIGGGVLAVSDGFTFRVLDHQVERLEVPRLPVRGGGQLALDERRGVIVHFGGRNADGAVRNDLFEWDGASWRHVLVHDAASSTRPSPRDAHNMAYARALGGVVVAGGCGGDDPGVLLPGCERPLPFAVWSWDGATFARRCEGPACGDAPNPLRPALVSDASGTLLAAGGQSNGGDAFFLIGAPRVFRFDGARFTAICAGACGAVIPPDVEAVFLASEGLPAFFGGDTLTLLDGEQTTTVTLSSTLTFDNDLFSARGVAAVDGALVVAVDQSLQGVSAAGAVGALAPRTLTRRCAGALLATGGDGDDDVRLVGGCGACENNDMNEQCENPLAASEAPLSLRLARGDTAVVGSATAVALNNDVLVVHADLRLTEPIGSVRRRSALATEVTTLPLLRRGYIAWLATRDGSTVIAQRGSLDDQFEPAFFGLRLPVRTINAAGVVADACTTDCGLNFTDGRGAMAARTRGGGAIAFGGDAGGASQNQTQELGVDGARGPALTLATKPNARRHGQLIYDAERDWTWLFGGTALDSDFLSPPKTCRQAGDGGDCGDLWRFDGAQWEEVRTAETSGVGRPPGRSLFQAGSAGGGLIVSGGVNGAGFFGLTARDDGWRLHASSTQQVTHQLLARYASYGPDASAARRIDVQWCGEAKDATGAAVGVAVRVWLGGAWRDVPATASGACVAGALESEDVTALLFSAGALDKEAVVEVLPNVARTGTAQPSLTTTSLTLMTTFSR